MMRDMEFEADPYWQDTNGLQKQQSKTSSTAMATMLLGVTALMVAARFWMPESAVGSSPLAVTAPSTRPSAGGNDDLNADRTGEENGWVIWLQNHLPGEKPVRVKSDFQAKWDEWIGPSAGWSIQDGLVHPGKLRLWKPTLQARDYEMQFRAGIEKKGLSWVYRAQDAQNYYATKIVLIKPGEASGASLIRYGVRAAQPFARSELPLPVALQQERTYNIKVVVNGSRFTTLLEGRVIDQWSDTKLLAGGVGFFADEGESSTIEWAEFKERKGWLSRWAAAAFFLPPSLSLPLP
ncbi:MAG: hypothetical protein HY858_14500 [Candidatus Solibacter usitatus]|nr:hypothetical protein [Candidatus Solibacter usitatus]